jgi:HK97 gp10 family phage protein
VLTVVVTGDREAEDRLRSMPAELRLGLQRKMTTLSMKLYRHILMDKLSGQVLRTVSGRLKRSIVERTVDNGDRIVSEIYSDGSAPYANIHEYGGKTAAHDIVATKAEALSFLRDGKRVFYKRVHHPGSRMPERSYMRSALEDMQEEIISELTKTYEEALRSAK